MKIQIDTDRNILTITDNNQSSEMPLYSDEAFNLISRQWLDVGWNQKYIYTFTWMGRPVIQLPDDLIRTQEIIWKIKPDVILETGIAHGGSLVFYASLCKMIGKGRVIGVDIEIRPHNRKAIESHPLFEYLTLIEGSSLDNKTIDEVGHNIKRNDTVIVFLDSCHTREHVLQELNAYHKFVSKDSYIVATDGIMQYVANTPRGNRDWLTDNPSAAAEEFVKKHPEFLLEQPGWLFNESNLKENITHWPGAWLKRI